MRANEFISEIDYTSDIEDIQIDDETIIKNSRVAGDLDFQDVWLYSTQDEELYYMQTNNIIDAYVIITANPINGYRHIHGIRNRTSKPGYVTAIVGFLTYRAKMKLKIAADEPLSNSGFNWLKSFLLSNGRGLTVTDQTGTFPDVTNIEKEWNTHRVKLEHGPTEIIIESNMTRNLSTKTDNTRLMRSTFFIGDSAIQ